MPPRRRTIEWADLAAAYWQGVQTGAASSVPRSSSLPTAYDTATSNVAAYDPFSVGPPPLEEVSSSPPHQYSIENLLDLTSPTPPRRINTRGAYDLEQLLSTGLASQARRETLERSRAQSAVNQALRSIAGGRNSHSSSAMQSSLETRIPPLPSVQSLGERMRPGESLDPNSQRLSYLSSLLGIENGSEDDEDSDYGAEDQMGDEIDEAIRQLEPGRGGSSEELQQAEAAVERLSSLFDGPSSSNSITLRRDLESSDDESMPPLEDIVSNTNAATASSVQATVQLDEVAAKDDTNLKSPTGKRKSDDDSKQPAKKKIKKEEKNLEEEESKANGSPKTCCICLEEPTKKELATINVCEHHFCFTCIDKWSDQENKCPLCKVRFYKIDKVHKPKKRKAGDAEGIGDNNERSSKRVRNRNQRCDHLDFLNAHPLEGMFASMEGGTWPTHIAQLLFSGLGGAPPPSLASGSFNPSRRNMPSSSRHPSSRVAALASARRQHEAAASRVASLRADIAARRQERAERLAERTARMQEWEESRRARAAAREARMASFDRRLADLSAARASLVNRGGSGTSSSASAIPARSQASRVNRGGVLNPPYHRSPFAIDTSSPWLSSSASSAMGRSQESRTSSRHSFPPESSRRRRTTSTTAASGAGGRRDDSTLLLQPGEEEEEERLLSTLSPGSYRRRLHREMNRGSSAQYAFNTTRPPRWRRNIHQQSAAGAPPPPPSSASSSSSSFRERMERIQRIRAGARAALGPPVQEAIEIDSDDDDDDVVEVIAVE